MNATGFYPRVRADAAPVAAAGCAGGALLAQAVRAAGLNVALSQMLERWRAPLARRRGCVPVRPNPTPGPTPPPDRDRCFRKSQAGQNCRPSGRSRCPGPNGALRIQVGRMW